MDRITKYRLVKDLRNVKVRPDRTYPYVVDIMCDSMLLRITLTKEHYIMSKKDIVQIKNPKSGHYVKIDRSEGKILDHKKSEGPYKGVPIARNRD